MYRNIERVVKQISIVDFFLVPKKDFGKTASNIGVRALKLTTAMPL